MKKSCQKNPYLSKSVRILGLALLCLGLSSTLLAESESKPNIIIILADDLGYGDISAFGSTVAHTPQLDALAAGGLRFTDFHSNGAVCSPTRAALLTGRYQQRTGITGVVTAKRHRDKGIPLDEITFAEIANQGGYTTGMFGKWHLGYLPKFNPVQQGFDEYIGFVSGNVDYQIHYDQEGNEDWWRQDQLKPEEGYLTDLITNHGIDFIQRHKEKPFVLYLAHGAPHYPYQGRESPPLYKPGQGKSGGATPNYSTALYKEMIEVMDEGIGRIRSTLEEAGLADNTLIFFASDNGPARSAADASAGPLRGRKGSIYEGGHRVPAIAYWPGKIPADTVSETPAMTIDLWPTIAEIAGVTIPDNLTIDGVSLLSCLTQAHPLPERPLFWGIGKDLAVRQGDFKLITNNKFQNPRLFNLKTDLAEKKNIAAEHPERVEALMQLIKGWHNNVGKN